MGNDSSKNSSDRPNMFGTRKGKPRVVLESPQVSNTEVTQQRVSFANTRSGQHHFKERPKMADIGTMPTDSYQSGKVRYRRNQTTSIGSSTNVNDSVSSFRSNASGPVGGNWEPILDPYGRTNALKESQNTSSYSRNSGGNYNRSAYSNNQYYGFEERNYAYNNEIEHGLANVDEI